MTGENVLHRLRGIQQRLDELVAADEPVDPQELAIYATALSNQIERVEWWLTHARVHPILRVIECGPDHPGAA